MKTKNQHDMYRYLNQLSMEQLEELLRVDFDSVHQENEDVVACILEIMETREKAQPTGRLPDVDQAWQDFQQYYDIPEGEGETLYPDGRFVAPIKEPSPAVKMLLGCLKSAAVVAACLMVILGGMLAGEACGFEAFASLGLWTDESTINYPPTLLASYMGK